MDDGVEVPTANEVQRGAAALGPFVNRWRLPLNPENVELMVYAVLRHVRGELPLAEIWDDSEKLLDEDAAAHARMLAKMAEHNEARRPKDEQ